MWQQFNLNRSPEERRKQRQTTTCPAMSEEMCTLGKTQPFAYNLLHEALYLIHDVVLLEA